MFPQNSNHEWGFSNDDFSSFTNLKLKYLAAIDEKYIHELSKDMFEMKDMMAEIIAKQGDLLDKMTFKIWRELKQYETAKKKGLRYRRNEINGR